MNARLFVGAVVLLVLPLAAFLLVPGRLDCQRSASMPAGCYWVTFDQPQAGDFAVTCLPDSTAEYGLTRGYLERGDCPNGAQPLLKVVAAADGDLVAVGSEGVRINGQLWPASVPAPADPAGRPMPALQLNKRLPSGEVLLLSSNYAAGFDGRYFGPISRDFVLGVAKPLW